jgi:Amidohydrolase family
MGPLKVVTDGALNTRTASCVDPYPGQDGDGAYGVLVVPPDQLVPLMGQAWANGISPAIHAIGDRANAFALDAFEAVGARGSIEHAQLLSRSDLNRFAALGVTASVQPEHAMDDRDVADHYWAYRPRVRLRRSGRGRSGARPGVRCTGRAARPLAGDRRRHASFARRPPRLASRAGDPTRDGTGRIGPRWPAHRRRRPRRPRRRRPRSDDSPTRRTAYDAGRRHSAGRQVDVAVGHLTRVGGRGKWLHDRHQVGLTYAERAGEFASSALRYRVRAPSVGRQPRHGSLAGCPSGQRERSVKPSAMPTLVRIQHLPPPARTARIPFE